MIQKSKKGNIMPKDVEMLSNVKGKMYQSFNKLIDWRTEINYNLDQFGEGEGSRILIVGSGLDTHIDLTRTFGYNLYDSNPFSTDDDIGHSTFIAGVIAGNGTHYIRGIAPKSELGAIKVVGKNSNFADFRKIETSLLWAKDNCATVVLIDLEFKNPITLPIKNAILALEGEGVPVFINARKNGDYDFTLYEAKKNHESCWLDNWYKSTTDIDLSIPISVGIAALIRSKFKDISTDEVYNKLDSVLVAKKSSSNRPKNTKR